MTVFLDDGDVQLYHGDVINTLRELPAGIAQTCVTSPPYWGLRDYGTGDGQLGLEATPDLYIERMVAVFREVWRVLRDDGTAWLNLGDSYTGSAASGGAEGARMNGAGNGPSGAMVRVEGVPTKRGDGLKPKDLVGIPWRVAFALQADGWYLRSDIVWSKPNPMPESVVDRPTKAHEYLFLLSKRPRYFYDADAIREPHETPLDLRRNPQPKYDPELHRGPDMDEKRLYLSNRGGNERGYPESGRNRRSVWTIPTEPFPEAHFATYPQALVRPCILAGSRPGDTIIDPFIGSGTTALVARNHGRRAIGIDLSAEYLAIAAKRLQQLSLLA